MWNTAWEYLIGLYSENQFLQGGIIIGGITSLGLYLKSYIPILWERIERYTKFYVTVEEHDSRRLYHFIEKWMREHHTNQYRNLKARLYEADYDKVQAPNPVTGGGDNRYFEDEYVNLSDSDDSIEEDTSPKSVLKLEQINDFFYIFYKKRYIRVSQSRERLEHASDFASMNVETYKFSSWFGKNQIRELLTEIVKWGESMEVKKIKKKTTSIYATTPDGETEFLHDIDIKELDKIIIKDKKGLLDDIDTFLKDRNWYKTRSIPYKRGYLFKGLAGNGKTTLSLSIAQYYDKDIIVANLSDMSNRGLERLFTQELNSRSILLLEDIDAMTKKRDNKDKSDVTKKEEVVSLSTVLNCLDGVFSKEGAIVIMTTNHPEMLDPALIRHGRVDYQFEITNPSKDSIEKYMSIFFESKVRLEGISNGKYLENISMVQVQNICIVNKEDTDKAINEVVELMKYEKKEVLISSQ